MEAQKIKWTIILEKDGGGFFGRLDTPNYLITTYGETIEQVTANVRDLIIDHLEHEGKDDPYFAGVNVGEIVFDCAYDLEAFFESINAVKISEIARLAELNPSLVRQYASGIKQASPSQVRKIEAALHELGKSLMNTQLV